jgi:hypothetical protein
VGDTRMPTGAEMEDRLETCPVCGRKSVAATAAKMRGQEYTGEGCPLMRRTLGVEEVTRG